MCGTDINTRIIHQWNTPVRIGWNRLDFFASQELFNIQTFFNIQELFNARDLFKSRNRISLREDVGKSVMQ